MVFLYATEFHRWYTLSLGGAVFTLNLVRYGLGRWQGGFYPAHYALWNTLFNATMVTISIAWGTLFFVTLRTFGLASYQALITVLIGSGISAALTTSVGPRQYLVRICLTFIIGLPLVHLLARMDRRSMAMAAIFLIYYVFLWAQLQLQHNNYWDSLRYRKRLSEENNRLQNILDAIPGLVSWIGRDLVLHGVNRNYANNYGGETAEFVGKSLAYKNADSEFLWAVRQFLESPAAHAAREVRLSGPGGQGARCHLVVMRKTNQDSEDPNALEVYSICLDIDELKRVESELEQHRSKSEQTSKLALVGEFTASIGHEIRNPLTSIVATLELIRRNLEAPQLSPEKLRALTDQAIGTCGRINRIIYNLTRFSRKTAEERFNVMPIAQIIRDSVELVNVQFRDNQVSLQFDPIDERLLVECRPIEVSQVIVNLLSNALDAAKATNEKWVRLTVRDNDEAVTIAVTDSGSRIPEKVVEKLFEPFFTTKPPGAGTGLGLSISRRIVERHHGRLEFDRSAPHTTFVVRLPLARRQKPSQPIPA